MQPHADQAAALLYGRLFELDPAVQRLFRGEMHAQGRKLMTTLGTVVADLDRPRELQPVIQDLGARHQRFRLTAQQFDTVGAALLW